jgi:lipopolysaccharide/colanic/teichoic acid biosynthesis glycosyltransferase
MLLSEKQDHATGVVFEAARTVNCARREVDCAGWYCTGVVFGVIFTEFGDDVAVSVSAIKDRMLRLFGTQCGTDARTLQVDFFTFPDDWERTTPMKTMSFYPEAEQGIARSSKMLKRLMDIILSTVMLILLAPLFLVIAAAIRLNSTGPVLFRQRRFGENACQFTMLKFRTMYIGCDAEIHQKYTTQLISGFTGAARVDHKGNKVYKLISDPRITGVGRILRKFSLDELPQLLNVFWGEMSLVGPRPPVAYEVAEYQPWHRARLIALKPGLTGLWQVSGRSRTTFDEAVRLDLTYIRKMSFWLDCQILLRTPSAVLTTKGAF